MGGLMWAIIYFGHFWDQFVPELFLSTLEEDCSARRQAPIFLFSFHGNRFNVLNE